MGKPHSSHETVLGIKQDVCGMHCTPPFSQKCKVSQFIFSKSHIALKSKKKKKSKKKPVTIVIYSFFSTETLQLLPVPVKYSEGGPWV